MKHRCRQIREILSLRGLAGLEEDAAAQDHVAGCSDCLADLEIQAELEEGLARLPALDVSDDVVGELLRTVQAEARLGEPIGLPPASMGERFRERSRRLRQRVLGAGPGRQLLAAAAVLVLAVFLGSSVWRGQFASEPGSSGLQDARFSADEGPPMTPGSGSQELQAVPAEELEKLKALGYLGGSEERDARRLRSNEPAATPEPPPARAVGGRRRAPADQLGSDVGGAEGAERFEPDLEVSAPVGRRMPIPDTMEELVLDAPNPEPPPPPPSSMPAAPPPPPMRAAPPPLASSEVQARLSPAPRKKQAEARREAEKEEAQLPVGALRPADPSHLPLDRISAVIRDEPGSLDADGSGAFADDLEGGRATAGLVEGSPAHRFLSEQERVEGLSFQEPAGYWANTYLPGDPVYRQLRARLLGLEEEGRQHRSEAPLRLHEEVRQAAQPFDPPRRAAMAVYLQGSRRSLEGRQRMLVQVGLQGTERRSGRRPPLNLALVLDLSAPWAPGDAGALRALVMALAEHRGTEDRFHLLVAGPGAAATGPLVVGPDEFRHGPLTLAMDRLFGLQGSAGPGPALEDTLEAAVREVSDLGADGPLGTSAVLLATTRPVGAATTARLARLARSSAIGGVAVSTIGIGDGVKRRELEDIALEGQGSHRWMAAPAEASALVDRELASVSRAVARALRLRIRLAAGVELVDVLGSYRLDASRAQAVRDAERSIDLHLARSLGIEADRGEDEDGIQIVIPAFYSGDAHVILLDVVAPGPGPVADVTVRYKDLVKLGNGVARDHLSLPRGPSTPGPLELNVLKNRLAFDLYQTLEAAGGQVAAGELGAARRSLEDSGGLLEGLRQEIPGLAQDRDLAADISLLGRYTARLGTGEGPAGEAQGELIDSLRLSARLKILPPPTGSDD